MCETRTMVDGDPGVELKSTYGRGKVFLTLMRSR